MIETLNHIIHIVGFGILFGFLFVFEPYVSLYERKFNYKPFNCVLCLSFWVSMLIYVLAGVSPVYAVYTALIAELTYRELVS
jgi:hypothetical protein